jgi:hypothetical protein
MLLVVNDGADDTRRAPSYRPIMLRVVCYVAKYYRVIAPANHARE